MLAGAHLCGVSWHIIFKSLGHEVYLNNDLILNSYLEEKLRLVRCVVLTAVKMTLLWVVTPCGLVGSYRNVAFTTYRSSDVAY
jgi:hypothetical protein